MSKVSENVQNDTVVVTPTNLTTKKHRRHNREMGME